MKPIETSFILENYDYTQVERQGDFAIYRQQHKANEKVVRFGVIRIRQRAERWGIDGFTCYTLPEAQALLAQLQGR